MTNFKPIKPPLGWRKPKQPSMYRACVNNDKAEFDACEARLMELYREVNNGQNA